MLLNPSVYIHPLFLSPGLFLYVTPLYDTISPAFRLLCHAENRMYMCVYSSVHACNPL